MIALWIMTVLLVLWLVMPTPEVRRRFGWRLLMFLGSCAWFIILMVETQGR